MPQPDWEDLERRIAFIERRLGIAVELGLPPAPPPEPRPEPQFSVAFLPILGRCLLGLAGAYLLRALTEAGTLAPRTGVAAGILYALIWLVWAARTAAERRLETALRSLTAVLVLSPLLWEATVNFHALSTRSAAALLLLFTIFGLAVSWRKNLLIVATICVLAGLGTAAGLMIATHDVVPFTLVFLAIAAAVEISACLEHWLSERWLAAITADLAVLLATWLVTNERGLPEAYAPIPYGWLLGSQIALLAIYLTSTIVRTLFRGFTFTAFETAQCAFAFFIGVGGGLRLSHAAPTVAMFALTCSVACYIVSFSRLEHDGTRGRNFYTYSTFGILLVIAGSRILLSGMAACAAWSALAVACIWAGGFFGRLTLKVHGAIYLLLALVGAGAINQAAAFVLAAAQWPGDNQAALWAGLAVAAACYWLAVRDRQRSPAWNWQALQLILAAAVVWLAAGVAAGWLTGIYHGVFGDLASHAYCATLRTAVLAGAALLLAWAGSRWSNRELSHLIYPLMIFGGYRLLLIDLHQDRKVALFLSLLVYGAALMALPRLTRARQLAPDR
jgi:hypothetical protein